MSDTSLKVQYEERVTWEDKEQVKEGRYVCKTSPHNYYIKRRFQNTKQIETQWSAPERNMRCALGFLSGVWPDKLERGGGNNRHLLAVEMRYGF